MNAKYFLITGLAILWGCCLAPGQTAPGMAVPPLPTGPLLRQATSFSAWEINYKYERDSNKKAPAAASPTALPTGGVSGAPTRQITIIRTYPVWRAVIRSVDGSVVDEWSDGKMQYFQSSARSGAELMTHDYTGNPLFPDFSKTGFPDMDWISAMTYAGVESVNGRPCLVFKKDDMIAWTDAETRYPVKWQRGEETRGFAELTPPASIQRLPPGIQALADAVRHDAEKTSRPPPPGG